MRFGLQRNNRGVSAKSDKQSNAASTAAGLGESFDQVLRSSYQGRNDDQSVKRQEAGRFNPVTGTYVASTSEPKRTMRLWPWIVLAFAAVALISTALNRADPQNIAAYANPDSTAAITVTGGQASDSRQAESPTDAPLKQVTITSEPVITPRVSSVQPITPTTAPIATPDPNSQVLKYGSKSDAVKILQGQLIQLGYLPMNSDDGKFGDGTKAAVQSFQKLNNLTADGIVGEKTLAIINGGQAKEDTDKFVWVVSKGETYHAEPDCSGLKDAKQIKKSEAEKRKLKPCEKCH